MPAFVISPWVKPQASNVIFDHTSILKTILLRFLPARLHILGPRVEQAAHVGGLLQDQKREDVPLCDVSLPEPAPGTLAAAAAAISDPTDFHLTMGLMLLPIPTVPRGRNRTVSVRTIAAEYLDKVPPLSVRTEVIPGSLSLREGLKGALAG